MKLKQILGGFTVAAMGVAMLASAASAGGPPSPDHRICYKAKGASSATSANESDQLSNGSQTREIKDKLAFVCVPSSVNGSSINDASANLACVKSKGAKFNPAKQVDVTSSLFNISGLRLELKKPKFLCAQASVL
jgi:hypothetical protein